MLCLLKCSAICLPLPDTETAVAEHGKQLCRVENFVNFHAPMSALCHGSIQAGVSELFEEPAVLFKEKINYKHAGGAGFRGKYIHGCNDVVTPSDV